MRGEERGQEGPGTTMRTILLVDDSVMIQALYKQLLTRRKDVRLASAANGKDALDRISVEGEPDLILLDVNMPVVDGLAFLEQTAGSGLAARVPVIIVSTEGTDADVARGIERGARGYLRKPFRPQELLATVERWLPEARPETATS
jgi:two-component system chemotaxis response regulator CheY